jgi:hypothetical protein
MPRRIVLDGDVIDAIERGNLQAAEEIRSLIESGATVKIGNWQYGELTGNPEEIGRGPSSPQTRAERKRLLEDLHIGVLPLTGKIADRMKLYERFAEHSNLQLGELKLLAEAYVHGYEIYSFDRGFRDNPAKIKSVYSVTVSEASRRTFQDSLPKRDNLRAREALKLDTSIRFLPNGRLVKSPKKKPPSGSGGHTGSSSGGQAGAGDDEAHGKPAGGKTGPKAVTGTPDEGPAVIGEPPPTRGQTIGDAVELALSGVNFIIQGVNDLIQANRIKEQWARIRPIVERRLAEDPTLGALILVRFVKRTKQGPEKESPLEHTSLFDGIDVAYGANASEAWENYRLQSRIGRGVHGDVDLQRFFMPPKKPVDIRNLRTPFAKYGVGTFVPGRASLMRVAWKGIFGFDEVGDVNLNLPNDIAPRFLLLSPPGEIDWFNGQERHTTDIALTLRDAGSTEPHITRSLTVVDMDPGIFDWGNDAAAMVFPADPTTERLFDSAGKTKDPTGQLSGFVNFDKLRWVRPENIHVLRKFMEEDDKIGSPKSPRPSNIQMKPQEDPITRPRAGKH